MFISFEYAAIMALTVVVATLLFAVSAAFLMVEEGSAAALRMLRRTMNTLNEGSGLQSRLAPAQMRSPSMALVRKNEIRGGGYLGIPR
jgi:hypothetical protein